eukprot:GHVU01066211.1.p1 GENE.GHVU01066211.1~~GHVU01066211.1.p1  ORF type:complete len:214 (+),score=35.37 GHVU01066211.1:370-1011(+)
MHTCAHESRHRQLVFSRLLEAICLPMTKQQSLQDRALVQHDAHAALNQMHGQYIALRNALMRDLAECMIQSGVKAWAYEHEGQRTRICEYASLPQPLRNRLRATISVPDDPTLPTDDLREIQDMDVSDAVRLFSKAGSEHNSRYRRALNMRNEDMKWVHSWSYFHRFPPYSRSDFMATPYCDPYCEFDFDRFDDHVDNLHQSVAENKFAGSRV